MILHNNMIPFFILTILIGAGYVAWIYRQIGRPATIGAGVGALAGAFGPFLFMIPLQSCTFEPDRDQVDYLFGLTMFFVGAAIFIFGASWASRYALSTGDTRAQLAGANDRTQGTFKMPILVPLLLLTPTLVILTYFIYYPAFETFRLSTFIARPGSGAQVFVCTRNFTQLLEPQISPLTIGLFIAFLIGSGLLYYFRRAGEVYSNGFKLLAMLIGPVTFALIYFLLMDIWEKDYDEIFFNTVFISAMIVVLGLIISLGIAYLAYQPVKGASIYRTLLIWPYAISPPIAGILFFVMFDPNAGIIDHIYHTFTGLDLPNYRTDQWLARFVVIMASVWKTLGYNILFYIAGLQTIPKELVEAAAIDGANSWQRFLNVVVPALSPITFFLIITNLTYAFFETFGTIDYLTKGAPAGATSVAIYEVYQVGVVAKRLGPGAAQSVVLFTMVILVTIWQFRTSGRRVTYGA